MYKKFNILFLLIGLSINIYSQDKKPFLIGFQPSLTKEKFYEKDEFDINIIPFVLQLPITKRVDFRYVNLANYHFNGNQGFSDVGGEICFPIFMKKKEQTNLKSGGIYLGPLLTVGRNFKNNHYTLTPALETGYLFHADNRFTASLGLQFGGSYFIYDELDPKWTNHIGFKANLGFWINTKKS